MFSDDPKNHNPFVNPKKVDSFVKWATIVWFFVTYAAAIVRGGQMNAFDVFGVVVGAVTTFGYWLKFSWPKVIVELSFTLKLLVFLGVFMILIAGPLVYLGFA